MNRNSNNNFEISPARRGQVIQRILVDGWTTGQAALAFGIAEAQVARWVAAYRRHGMASLRGEPATAYSPASWVRALYGGLARRIGAFRSAIGIDLAACVEFRQHRDDRHRDDRRLR